MYPPPRPSPELECPRVEWTTSSAPVTYPDAVAAMEKRVGAILEGEAGEWIWLLEHPPLYTAGTSARASDLLVPERFPVFASGRGGQYTYHGPGQRVAYVMLDLRRREQDVRRFVADLEEWIIRALSSFGVKGERRAGRVGIWIAAPDGREAKIAAIGVRLRRWVSFHGIAVNVHPDLGHFAGIVPCGIVGHGVTSLREQGCPATLAEVDAALKSAFREVFGE